MGGTGLARNGPLFTVIIPTRNRVDTLERAIAGVLAQDERDLELIIVDDGSTDETATYLAGMSDPRIAVLTLEGRGVSAARNAGIHHARGTYVAFFDSDDEVLPSWLARLGQLLRGGAAVASCGATVIDEADGSKTVRTPSATQLLPAPALFLAGTFAVERQILLDVGGYDEMLNHSENTELGIRLIGECAQRGASIVALEEPLTVIYRDTRRASARRKYEAVLHVLRRHEGAFRANRRAYSLWAAVAAVDAARDGEFSPARRLLAMAVRRDPRYWPNVVRLATCCVPPLARRLWTRRGDRSP